MANFHLDTGIGRREVIRFAVMSGITCWTESYVFAADFWEKKQPSEWTDKEKEELRTKSPWAKKVDADLAAGGGGRGGGGGGGGGGRGGGGGGGGGGEDGGGGGGGGGRGGGRGGGSAAPSVSSGGASVTLEVVWQSAKPIQDAHLIAFPPKLDSHYVIAVTGIPQQVIQASIMGRGGGRGGSGRQFGGGRPGGAGSPGGGGSPGGAGSPGGGGSDAGSGGGFGGQASAGAPPAGADSGSTPPGPPAQPPDPTAGLRRGSTLTVKGKAPQNADVVMAMNNNATILFGFAKDALSLSLADKEVEFDLKLGNMSGKAKFNLKDMMYHEELAL